jgi:hypothetical protein
MNPFWKCCCLATVDDKSLAELRVGSANSQLSQGLPSGHRGHSRLKIRQ